eukprot:gene16920-25956_t
MPVALDPELPAEAVRLNGLKDGAKPHGGHNGWTATTTSNNRTYTEQSPPTLPTPLSKASGVSASSACSKKRTRVQADGETFYRKVQLLCGMELLRVVYHIVMLVFISAWTVASWSQSSGTFIIDGMLLTLYFLEVLVYVVEWGVFHQLNDVIAFLASGTLLSAAASGINWPPSPRHFMLLLVLGRYLFVCILGWWRGSAAPMCVEPLDLDTQTCQTPQSRMGDPGFSPLMRGFSSY